MNCDIPGASGGKVLSERIDFIRAGRHPLQLCGTYDMLGILSRVSLGSVPFVSTESAKASGKITH